MDRRRYLLWTASAVTVGLAGCSDEQDVAPEGTSPTATETPTDTPTEEEMATETGTPTEEEMATATPTETATEAETSTETGTPTATDRPPVAAEVTVGPGGDFRFAPPDVSIAPGETVRWVWDSIGHNVKPSSIPDGSDWSGTSGDRSETYGSDYVYTHTFEVAGSYEYVCVPHESLGMTGSIDVSE